MARKLHLHSRCIWQWCSCPQWWSKCALRHLRNLQCTLALPLAACLRLLSHQVKSNPSQSKPHPMSQICTLWKVACRRRLAYACLALRKLQSASKSSYTNHSTSWWLEVGRPSLLLLRRRSSPHPRLTRPQTSFSFLNWIRWSAQLCKSIISLRCRLSVGWTSIRSCQLAWTVQITLQLQVGAIRLG